MRFSNGQSLLNPPLKHTQQPQSIYRRLKSKTIDADNMSDNQEENDTREISIEAWNMVFGRAMFAYIRLPVSWITGYQINEPMVTNRFLYKNLVWVGVGDVECLISCRRGEKKRPSLDFKLKVAVDLKKDGPIAPGPDEIHRNHVEKGHEVIDCKKLHAGGHEGSYILWTAMRRRFIVAGEHRLQAKLIGYIPCTETNRLLTLSWTSPRPELLLEHSGKLIDTLNSVMCHGHNSVTS
jgi:hypothetical protein